MFPLACVSFFEVKAEATEPSQEGLVAWFKSEDAAAVWPSSVGSSVGVVHSGSVRSGFKSGNGASGSVRFISGDTSSQYAFGGDILSITFTICSVSRYTGAAKGRILLGSKGNLLHGHWGGSTGVAFYEDWVTDNNRNKNNMDWVVLCGTNGAARVARVVDRTGNVGTTATNKDGNNGLQINFGGCCGGETSDWAVMEVAMWNRVMSSEEMRAAVTYLHGKLSTGVANDVAVGTPLFYAPKFPRVVAYFVALCGAAVHVAAAVYTFETKH